MRPMPPVVAQKTSGSRSRWMSSTSPVPVTSRKDCTLLPKVPSTWWPLPWMSLAIVPPTVTKRVPGVTRNQPRGMSHRMSESRLVPA